jgi:hypothetical protein
MATTVSCPSCSRKLLVPVELQGKSVRCPTCDTVFTARLEEPEQSSAPPPTEAPDVSERLSSVPSGPAPEREEDRPGWRGRWQEDEDYYDGPEYGRGFRGGSRSAALAAVSGPATALQVTGGIALALSVLSLSCNLIGAAGGFAQPGGRNQNQNVNVMVNAASGVMGAVFGIAYAILILIGAGKMKRLESFGFAMASSIIAMVPCTVCCILGLPFGIWSLVVLNKPEVRDSFR